MNGSGYDYGFPGFTNSSIESSVKIEFENDFSLTGGAFAQVDYPFHPEISTTLDSAFIVVGLKNVTPRKGILMKFDSNGGLGCSDENACNYSPYEDYINTQSCIYAENNYDCDGNCIAELDECGVCGGNGIEEACDCVDTSGLNDDGCCDAVEMGCDVLVCG